uniref:30S ribosomal protein S16, chloroplastic n=1 Tax=Elaeagnus umbellata TaxID=43233 RepID=A0A8F2FKI4_ELAUM|nr:ribosomal protein S16 [Elaeagnus umbellata]
MVKLRLKRCGRKQRFFESLQLMFDPEEKEEIFEKWVFMIRERIKPILMFLLFYIFLKKGLGLQELFMIFQRKRGVYRISS